MPVITSYRRVGRATSRRNDNASETRRAGISTAQTQGLSLSHFRGLGVGLSNIVIRRSLINAGYSLQARLTMSRSDLDS
jgi:hypothetical protein